MTVCSTTALRKYLIQRSNLRQPLRERAGSTTRGHAEGETLSTSGTYRRPLFKSSLTEPSAKAAWETFSNGYGPTKALAASLDENRRAELRRDFIAFHEQF